MLNTLKSTLTNDMCEYYKAADTSYAAASMCSLRAGALEAKGSAKTCLCLMLASGLLLRCLRGSCLSLCGLSLCLLSLQEAGMALQMPQEYADVSNSKREHVIIADKHGRKKSRPEML